jgi:hypothetical protein
VRALNLVSHLPVGDRSPIGKTTPSDLHSRITERRSATGPTLADSPPTQLSAASIASPEQGMPASEAKADYPRHSSDFAGIDGILVGWVARVTGSCKKGRPPKEKWNLR